MGHLISKTTVSECAVCYDKLNAVERVYALTCGHVFCGKCVYRMIVHHRSQTLKCLMCRRTVVARRYTEMTFKCSKCTKCLFLLKNQNIQLKQLACCHFYCVKCVKPSPMLYFVVCTICKTYELLMPLYL